MNKSKEIVHLQQEITRLKNRLSQLDSDVEPTSVACGHDILLNHIRKLCNQSNIKGISQIAYLDEEWGWSTTNIETRKVRKLMSYEGIEQTLGFLLNPKIWNSLTDLYHNENNELNNEIEELLLNKKIIDAAGKLTSSGVFLYTVTAHLCFNFSVKQDISIASQIFEQVFPITKTPYGEQLKISYEELLVSLKSTGWNPIYLNCLFINISSIFRLPSIMA
ncbi:MAG: hypothetical protein PF518_09890, partial [Spirochaetaceae bacterium]|nr:hypothetical protein [Spirochaetaceae bacterium]